MKNGRHLMGSVECMENIHSQAEETAMDRADSQGQNI